ncbi:carbonic anhydrase 4-like [Brachionus plicatilis]|uniref:Carbonic anhydrase n=1 Tax=Brachionus plicatilis TaxID=10195 RepID=A0A3M7QG78_BRAPC|nr:carbonic anhydrase 4-like [Brachionus plicatilis]
MFFKLFFASCLLTIIHSAEWNYENLGPDYWKNNNLNGFEACKLTSQSPINIEQSSAKYDSNLGNFAFFNYSKSFTWTAKNNGHSISLETGEDSPPNVEGSDFSEKFNLLGFHFHWGYNIYQGSEHVLDGNKFPLEVHLVHQSVKPNGSIAVLGFFFEISQSDNENLNPLIDVANLKDNKTKSVQYSLSSMIPNATTLNSNGYFRYSGSFTTPPCTEGVIWTVFKQKILISEAQVKKFYESEIKINFRDVQPLNGRTITTNINTNTNTNNNNSAKSYFFNNCL